MAEVLPCCWRQLSGLLWLAETNSITQAGYKAGMIYLIITQSIRCRGIAPPNLHTSQKKQYIFISQIHTYSAEILGTHSSIHCSSRKSFTYYPSPSACAVCNRGLPLVVVGMKSEVFLAKARRLSRSDLFTVHWNRSQSFILYCSFSLCLHSWPWNVQMSFSFPSFQS